MVPSNYLRTYRNNAVLTASPGQLVLMLYDGALRALDSVIEGFARPETDYRRLEAINRGLLKANAILGELRGNLDLVAGGDVAKSLADLYDFYIRHLEQANFLKDMQRVLDVQRLLQQLRDGWAEMLVKGQTESSGQLVRTA